jgi:RraA family protein
VSNIGFRILGGIQRPEEEVVAGFLEAKPPTPNVTDVMGRFGAVGRGMYPVNGDGVYLVGPALTVKTHPSDNLMVHKALDLAEPGDVIVVDAGGDMTHAILGELMCSYARRCGIAGAVVDGAVRDGASIRRMGYPVFARGLAPRGPYKEGPGEINVPVSCGGVAVCPGDLIVGDGDGAVVVPRQSAAEVLDNATALQRQEEAITKKIAAGEWERAWVDETLLKKGCELGG